MKNENKGTLVIIILTLFIAGAFGLFYMLKENPNLFVQNITKVEKDVTVTDTGIADAVEKIYDAVVIVSTYKDDKLKSTGTGFVYKEDGKKGYILTNNHVIQGGTKITVTLTNGEVMETDVVGSDVLSDIAVLSLDSKHLISVSEIGNSDKLRVGDTTFAVGAPLDSVYSWTVTRGIISGKDRMVEVNLASGGDYVMKVLQTDAAINSGNSGGPLCNINGEVIGITSLKLVDESVEGMGFAIPIETALEHANNIIEGKKIEQPYLGVSMINIADAYANFQYSILLKEQNVTNGVLIVAVEDGSPADKAGLKVSDVIIKLNDKEVKSVGYLRYFLYDYSVGDKITITYMRDGKEKTTTVTLKSNKTLY